LYLGYDNTQTLAGVQTILQDTFMNGSYTCTDTGDTYSYAQTILDAAAQSGAGAYYLAARIRQEVGANGSALSSGTVSGYAGYYNFFNIGATQKNGNSALTNGAIRAKSEGWTSVRKAILGGANYVAAGYIAEDQDTLYLQRFNALRGVYWHQYMTNIAAPTSEARNLKKAYSDQLNTALVFHIPVYTGMPETISPQPAASGDNNNFLDNLSVNGTVVSGFDRYTGSYHVDVAGNVSSVTVAAVANSSAAQVSGTGPTALAVGNNTVTVTVTASGGEVRVYTLTICRAADATNTTDTTTTTTTTTTPPPAVRYGDVNGDNTVTMADVRLVLRAAVDKTELSGDAFTSADVNGDNTITMTDVRLVLRYAVDKIASFPVEG